MKQYPFRQMHIDFHTSGLIERIGEKFDPDTFARTLVDAKVQAVNLFAKCHHGYFYYDTAIGVRHPHLAFDLLGAQIDACNKAGIRANIYYSVGIDEVQSTAHPDWTVRTVEGYCTMGEISGKGMAAGNPLMDKDRTVAYGGSISFWKFMCINNPDYRARVLAEVQEILERFHPPGLWLDIYNQSACACETCAADMRQAGMDPTDDGEIYAHGRLVEARFFREVLELARRYNPDIEVYNNGLAQKADLVDDERFSAKTKVTGNTVIDIESLPSFLWSYNHYTTAVQYMNRKYEDVPITMMSGRFHRIWGDFGTLKNIEAMQYECYRALCYGSRVSLGDQMHPNGTLEPAIYAQIGQVFADVEQKEPWCEGSRKVSEIGVFLSNRALEGIRTSTEGALRVLTELGYQFDFIDYESDLSMYATIILPDDVPLNDAARNRLRLYLEGGGAVLITGKSDLALSEYGINIQGPSEYSVRYFMPQGFSDLPPMDYATYLPGFLFTVDPDKAAVLAVARDPYFERSQQHFSSHFQTPVNDSAIPQPFIAHSGNLIYIAAPLFSDYEQHGVRAHRKIIEASLELLHPCKLVRCKLPTTAAITLRRGEGSLIMHVLNYIIQNKCLDMEIIEESFPLNDTRFSVHVHGSPKEVRLVPEMQKLDFTYNPSDGYVSFSVDLIDGHRMVEIVL